MLTLTPNSRDVPTMRSVKETEVPATPPLGHLAYELLSSRVKPHTAQGRIGLIKAGSYRIGAALEVVDPCGGERLSLAASLRPAVDRQPSQLEQLWRGGRLQRLNAANKVQLLRPLSCDLLRRDPAHVPSNACITVVSTMTFCTLAFWITPSRRAASMLAARSAVTPLLRYGTAHRDGIINRRLGLRGQALPQGICR